jgi:hypothetical protein
MLHHASYRYKVPHALPRQQRALELELHERSYGRKAWRRELHERSRARGRSMVARLGGCTCTAVELSSARSSRASARQTRLRPPVRGRPQAARRSGAARGRGAEQHMSPSLPSPRRGRSAAVRASVEARLPQLQFIVPPVKQGVHGSILRPPSGSEAHHVRAARRWGLRRSGTVG